ncbi:hypothetical protein C5C07_11400 [Haloferax sp. Atlit-4N]|nr:hypothetical protein C5C07_11400 [Haloferax sp. Atlit-4N]
MESDSAHAERWGRTGDKFGRLGANRGDTDGGLLGAFDLRDSYVQAYVCVSCRFIRFYSG